MFKASFRFTFWSALLLFGMSSCGLFRPASGGSLTNDSHPRSGTVISSARQAVIEEAQLLLGTKYKYGGNTPREGFDCSGFTVYAYQQAGLRLPRTSQTQADVGERVRESQVRPGDLVFFRRGGRVFHVSLVVETSPGGVWVIHSTSSRGVIRENILASTYWKPKISDYRNVLGH